MNLLREGYGFPNGVTNNHQLMNLGRELFKNKFKGVVCRDVPLNEKGYYIVNTDTSTGRGKHWTAVSTLDNLFYDSFGKPSSIIDKSIPETYPDREQCYTEENCGLRAMSWLLLLNDLGKKIAILV